MTAATFGPVHVALAFDDNFWAPAVATMRSISLASRRPGDLFFHLFHSPLAAAHTADLDRAGQEFGARLIHHDVLQSAAFRHLAEILAYGSHISGIACARLFVDRLLDASIGRLVYVDCDVFVRGPIEELAGIDLAGAPLGAVKDPGGLIAAFGRDLAQRRDLFEPADPYFNSGVLVIDLAAWRAMDVTKRILGLEERGLLARLHGDQQVLNLIFRNNWRRLDGAWNALACGEDMEALEPRLVHYSGLGKPWNLLARPPFGRAYRQAMGEGLFWRYLRHRWGHFWRGKASSLFGFKRAS